MPNIFVISDPHFGHANIITFYQGKEKMRDFATVEEMNEHLVTSINAVVRPQDQLYILGDVCLKKKDLPILGRLNGELKLVRGNHDTCELTARR